MKSRITSLMSRDGETDPTFFYPYRANLLTEKKPKKNTNSNNKRIAFIQGTKFMIGQWHSWRIKITIFQAILKMANV